MNKKILYKNKDSYYMDGRPFPVPPDHEFLEAGIQKLTAKATQLCVERCQSYYVVMEKRPEEQYADRLGTFYPRKSPQRPVSITPAGNCRNNRKKTSGISTNTFAIRQNPS